MAKEIILNMKGYDFTIAFVASKGTYEYFEKTLKNNIEVICGNTIESFDLIMFLDGLEVIDYAKYIELAKECGIGEVRLRNRLVNCASGDGANNPHMHLVSEETKYLITIEADIAVFKTQECDILREIREIFETNENLCVATRIDDYDCWQEKMYFLEHNIGKGIRSVNRVSSHFLAYDTKRCCQYVNSIGGWPLSGMYDTGAEWHNFEDRVGKTFRYPDGPGIGYIDSIPFKVYHCDEKIAEGSPFYKRDIQTRLRVFDERKRECDLLYNQSVHTGAQEEDWK